MALPLFHHTLPLEYCQPGIISSCPERLQEEDDVWFKHFHEAYAWLSERIGCWPLFLSVGKDQAAWYMTGYAGQWSRILGTQYKDGKIETLYRQKGQFPSLVMFSFDDLPEASFSSFHWWHCALNGASSVTSKEEEQILRPHYSPKDWILKSNRDPGSVQAHVKQLDLSQATRIWCRSKAAKQELIDRGFDSQLIEVKHLPVGPW